MYISVSIVFPGRYPFIHITVSFVFQVCIRLFITLYPSSFKAVSVYAYHYIHYLPRSVSVYLYHCIHRLSRLYPFKYITISIVFPGLHPFIYVTGLYPLSSEICIRLFISLYPLSSKVCIRLYISLLISIETCTVASSIGLFFLFILSI